MTDGRPRLVVASENPGKLAEIRTLLAGAAIEPCSLAGLAPVSFPEEGTDYEENARAKARAVAEQLGLWAVGDDSGLEVDALDGAPGPLSARYGGPGLDDAGRVRRLLDALSDVPDERRGARFVCVAAWATPEGDERVFRGECTGVIVRTPRGDGGFGYDPVFRPDGHSITMAELTSAQKHAISHRGRAFRALADALAQTLS